MQEIIYELKPDILVETGTFMSGSAMYYCGLFDLLGKGRVVSVDIEFRELRPKHPRLRHILGSSTDKLVVEEVRKECEGKETVLIVLDSSHYKDHVLDEIYAYEKMVTKGSYLIVEDTALHGNPIHPEGEEDPMWAVEKFMHHTKDFVADRSREKFLMTWHPKGFLKKL
jgi:cephalosporin hydroxylase